MGGMPEAGDFPFLPCKSCKTGRMALREQVMKVGLIYPQTELQGDPAAVRRIGLATEEIGYYHLLAYDHVLGAHHDRTPPPNGPGSMWT